MNLNFQRIEFFFQLIFQLPLLVSVSLFQFLSFHPILLKVILVILLLVYELRAQYFFEYYYWYKLKFICCLDNSNKRKRKKKKEKRKELSNKLSLSFKYSALNATIFWFISYFFWTSTSFTRRLVGFLNFF